MKSKKKKETFKDKLKRLSKRKFLKKMIKK